MKLLLYLVVPSLAFAQLWSGIIDPSRAADWSTAGVTGGIPARTTKCTTLGTAGQAPSFVQSVTITQINNALSACASGQTVFLNPGTYNLATGIDFGGGKSNVTLRGSGADQTILVFADDFGCNGARAAVCLHSSDTNWKGGTSNSANWTAGYTKGTTTITLSGVTNLKVGNPLILDQLDTTADDGSIVVTDTTGTGTHSGTGVGGPYSLEGNGGGNQRSGRQQQQIVTVASCDGNSTPGHACSSGTNITISPGLYMPNWSSGLTPQAWWATSPALYDGLEDLSIDSTSLSTSDAGVTLFNCSNCWVKGVRSIDSGRAHVQLQYSPRSTVRDSYFFLTQNSRSQSYGWECYGSADSLVENNIIQAVAAPIMVNGNCSGSVIGYNYSINNFYTLSDNYNAAGNLQHTAGEDNILIEGNYHNTITGDVFHGTHHFVTAFRNRLTGPQPKCYNGPTNTPDPYASATFGACTQNNNPIFLLSFSRFYNLIGNVLGTTGTNTTYGSVYSLGSGNSNGTVTVPADSNVAPTLMRWGNCDSATGFGSCKFDSSEVPSSLSGPQAPYSNPVPASQALPASFYYSAQPAWWPSGKAWPPIGPDVTGGNVSGTGGRAYTIPAQDCALNTMGMPADGTGPVKSFNASLCYSASGVSTPTVTTTVASSITTTTAQSGGTVTSNGGASVTSEGVCYATTANPTTPCTSDGTATPFVSNLPVSGSLTPGTLYHYRAFATNSAGTAYGSDLTFTTLAPNVSLNPTSLAFGSQGINTTSSAKSTTLTNTGTATLNIVSIALVGTNAADYTISSNTCGATVAVNGTCSVSVTFSPSATGSRVATLQFTTDDPGSPDNLTITGTGVNVSTVKGTLVFGGAGFPGVK